MHSYLILYFIFIQISLLIPGYAFVKRIGLLKESPGIQLCLAYVFALLIFTAFAIADYAFKLSPVVSRYLCWAIILGGCALFIKENYYRALLKLRFPLFCLLAMNIFSLAFISLNFNASYKTIPDPTPLPARNYSVLDVKILNVAQTNANDNYVPYRQAQFFVNRSDPAHDSFIGEWGVSFFQRTPLMGAVVSNYFNLLNDKPPANYAWSSDFQDRDHTFIKFQVIAQVLNGLLIVPGFLLLSEFFKRKTAILTCLFLITSQFFVYNAFFSWPKSLVAFFVLASWLLLLGKNKLNVVLAGVVAGVAYLTHDLASLYIGTSLIYLAITKRFRDILLYTLPSLMLAAPWLLAASLKYHKPSSFIYYPFSTDGIPQTSNGSAILNKFFHTSPLTLMYIRVKSFFYLISPYQLLSSEGGQELVRRLWALGLYSVPGALGFGLIIPGYISIIRLCKKFYPAIILIILPIIFSVLLIGWSIPELGGLGAMHFAEAAVVIWSGLAVYWLIKLRGPLILFLAYILNCLQFVLFLFYSYGFKEANWLNSPRDVMCLAVMLTIILLGGWLIYACSSNQKNWLTA